MWSVITVIIGSFVFREEKMMIIKKGSTPYNSFWYSLDLFVPYIDLGISKKWMPSPNAIGMTIYNRIHQIMGWVVVPIALLSVSGYFK